MVLWAGLFWWVGGKKIGGEGLCDPLRARSERKGRQLQFSCYRAGDEIWELGLRKSRNGMCLPSVYWRGTALGGAALKLSGGTYWSWDLGQSNVFVEECYKGKTCGICRRWRWCREGCCGYSVADVGISFNLCSVSINFHCNSPSPPCLSLFLGIFWGYWEWYHFHDFFLSEFIKYIRKLLIFNMLILLPTIFLICWSVLWIF